MTSVPLKYAADLNTRVLPEETDGGYTFRYVDISQVSGNGHLQLPQQEVTFGGAPSRARRIARPGDTVISTVRTYLRAIAHVPDTDERLVFSTGFTVASPRQGTDGRFLSWACQSDDFVSQVVARSTGVSYPAINPSDLAMIPVPLPPLDVQRRIADFLDDQVARIDQAANLRNSQVLLTAAQVRSRIDELLWEAASHQRVKFLVTSVTSGPRGWGDLVSDEGAPFLRIGNLPRDGIQIDVRELAFVQAPDTAEARRATCRTGDVLMGITASLGDCASVTPEFDGSNFSQHVARLRPRPGVDSRWLAWGLQSTPVRQALEVTGYGGTKVGLSLDDVRNITVPVVGESSAQQRLSRIERAWDLTAKLRLKLIDSQRLLAERKQSLITAAVTDEFDVSAASSRAAEVALSGIGGGL